VRVAVLPDGFTVATDRGDVLAERVVVATGSFHSPRVPSVANRLSPDVTHVHSHHYRNRAQLPPGGVLVVGSGQSGVQLAEELSEAGRRVVLSVGSAGRTRRRYRGRDFFWWLAQVGQHGPRHGLGLPTVDRLPNPAARFAGNPHVSGHRGGHETNLRQFALDGMTLTGRLVDIDGTRAMFARDLRENLARADRFFEERFRGLFETYAERARLHLPPDEPVTVNYEPPELTALDLAAEGVSTVLWSSGYRPEFGWIAAPILDEFGLPRHVRGVSEQPGLYFLGLQWQHTQASATLFGPAVDGRHLVEHMRSDGAA
jgi:putative flavoprotein involved in K+ transport